MFLESEEGGLLTPTESMDVPTTPDDTTFPQIKPATAVATAAAAVAGLVEAEVTEKKRRRKPYRPGNFCRQSS